MALDLLPLVAPSDSQTGWRRLVEKINQLLKLVGGFVGGSNANVTNFGAGFVAFGGLDNSLQGSIQLEFGTNLPNPAGLPGPALFIGSGGGGFTGSISGTVMTVTAVSPGTLLGRGMLIKGAAAGTGIASLGTGTGGVGTYNVNVSQSLASTSLSASASAWILTDQAYDNSADGNFIGITAGETQGAGTANGGELFLAGGGSFGGLGGLLQLQGGTSAHAAGGSAVLQGGSATGSTGAAVPGDAFVSGGVIGKQGGNVHLIATLLNGIPGDVRIRINSTILMQFLSNGEIYLTASGTGAGLAGQALVSGGVGAPAKWLTGFTGSKVIGGQTYTWASGILISVV